MKVLFLNQTFGYGGAAKMMAFVANALSKNNHEVTALLYKGSEIQQRLESNIKVINRNFESQGKLKHLKLINRLKKVVKEENPDVIVSFLTFPNFYATIIGHLLRIPVIISERGNPFLVKGVKDSMIYKCFNLANGAVFQTDGAKSYFGKGLQERSCVIPNPVVRKNKNIRFDLSTDNHEIVFVARFENKQKRQDLMLEALEKVVSTYPDTILRFYGTGDDMPKIEEMVRNKQLEKHVRFMGYTNTPEEVMLKSEVFVLTSDYEGIPNTLIEAMSIGMPVVSTDCDPGGARMLIEDGVNGLIVRKNNAQEIADAIIRVFSDIDLRQKMSREAYKITEKYTEKIIFSKWVKYITHITNKK